MSVICICITQMTKKMLKLLKDVNVNDEHNSRTIIIQRNIICKKIPSLWVFKHRAKLNRLGKLKWPSPILYNVIHLLPRNNQSFICLLLFVAQLVIERKSVNGFHLGRDFIAPHLNCLWMWLPWVPVDKGPLGWNWINTEAEKMIFSFSIFCLVLFSSFFSERITNWIQTMPHYSISHQLYTHCTRSICSH